MGAADTPLALTHEPRPSRGVQTLLAVACLLIGCGVVDRATADAVRSVARVTVDGTKLWLLLRGHDDGAQPVLWLHGGPGAAETPFFRLYNRDLERAFVMAYWDQRGAGRSFDADADPRQLTVARHLRDLDRIVDFIRGRLGVERVALIGHSWGSALGLRYAQQHPGKVLAFVGVGQLVNELGRQRAQREFALTQARAAEDPGAVESIQAIGLPPYSARQELAMERWVNRYGGVFHRSPNLLGAALMATLRGYVRPWEIGGFIRANRASLDAMMPELTDLDLYESVPAVEVPVLFALGRHDRQVDARIAADYFDVLQAEHKRLVWFDQSAHNVPFEEPERFNAEVRQFLNGILEEAECQLD